MHQFLPPRPGMLPPTLKVRFVKLHVAPWSELRAMAPLLGSQLIEGSINNWHVVSKSKN